ncbi:MAG: ATP-binding protein, partial [Bacteroidia bacterium]|nr:ATP-binding protein [Bacteroidia bacterium]
PTLIELISNLHIASADCALEDAFFQNQSKNLKTLCAYFNTTEKQTLFLASLVYLCQSNDIVDLHDVAAHYDYPVLNMLLLQEEFNALEEKFYIKKQVGNAKSKVLSSRVSYKMNEKLLNLIFKQSPIAGLECENEFEHEMQILEQLNFYCENPDEAPFAMYNLPLWLQGVLEKNDHFALVAWLNKLQISPVELSMLSLIIWDTVNENYFQQYKLLKEMFLNNADWWNFRSSLINERNSLFTLELLEKKVNRNYANYELSESSMNKIKELGIMVAKIVDIKKHDNNESFLEDFTGQFSEAGTKKKDQKTDTELLCKIIEQNTHLSLVDKFKSLGLQKENEIILYLLAWNILLGKDKLDIDAFTENYFTQKIDRIYFLNSLYNTQNELICMGYIKIIEEKFFNNAQFQLTEEGKVLMREGGLNILTGKVNRENILLAQKLITKPLYYPEKVASQVDQVAETLKEDNLDRIREKLSAKGMTKGISVLLHGAPGTGKTETVYQLAKQSNRNIFKVDISDTKSMWFGESEKKVKNIFKEYQKVMKNSASIPILLFNEADAVISKRMENINTTSSKVENSLQNILLEELENFDGILFATTNLVKNIDAAFDRRFLFKIEFDAPDTLAKMNIWKSRLPELAANYYKVLAETYDFTGGQIENIARKIEINSLLSNEGLPFEKILNFCNQETLNRQGNKQ